MIGYQSPCDGGVYIQTALGAEFTRNSASYKQRVMPFEYDWAIRIPQCGEEESEDFLDAQKSYYTHKSQEETCQLCFDRRNPHSMTYKIYTCKSQTCKMACSSIQCEWHVKVLSCNEMEDRPANCVVYQHGEHHTELRSPPKPALNLAMKRECRKALVLRAMPNAIRNLLISKFNLPPERVIGLLPKIQSYCGYYRKVKMQETALVDDMEMLIQTHRYRTGLDDNKAFVFGFTTDEDDQSCLGTGGDEDPVVVGFATAIMIRRLSFAATNVLHIDATGLTLLFPVLYLVFCMGQFRYLRA